MKTLRNVRLKKSRFQGWLNEGEGQGQIEFILSIITIMFVIFWTWEVVLAVYTYNVLSDATKEGVRYAIVHGSNNEFCSGPSSGKPSDGQGGCQGTGTPPQIATPPSCAMAPAISPDDTPFVNVQNVVKCYAALSLQPQGSITGMNVIVNYPKTNNPPDQVNVTVAYSYVPFLALPITPVLSAASSGRIVN